MRKGRASSCTHKPKARIKQTESAGRSRGERKPSSGNGEWGGRRAARTNQKHARTKNKAPGERGGNGNRAAGLRGGWAPSCTHESKARKKQKQIAVALLLLTAKGTLAVMHGPCRGPPQRMNTLTDSENQQDFLQSLSPPDIKKSKMIRGRNGSPARFDDLGRI